MLQLIQPDNKIKYVEKKKSKINIDTLKKNREEFIRNNESVLKTQQRFNSERHNVVIEKCFKIALKAR